VPGEYLEVLTQGREKASRVVDKMPGNFLFAGLIAALFPNATMIHAVRNPLDTALSCYRQNFASLPWTNSFESIAQFYALYRDMMRYWQKVLPAGRIVDIHYERLVEDPETEARRLLEACGLDWDPSVLDNFRKGGVVRTASIAQVRQPVYRTSRRAWVNYAAHLEPLAKALAPWLKEQRAELAEHGIRIGSAPGLLRRIMS